MRILHAASTSFEMRRLRLRSFVAMLSMLFIAVAAVAVADDTLLPLKDGRAPTSIDDIWVGFDPRNEPLEVELLKEWDEDDVVCRIVRYRVGIFKGEKSCLAGLYAFPKGAAKLPGLIQVHGGGQSANLNAATTNARRGYACLSLNWGGNPLNDGKYQKLWDTPGTYWGNVDATHPPKRDPINHFAVLTPNEFTLDAVESPRNSAWLLVAMGVRRGLTFLEQQPEVDGTKLGVYGHSMGGKLTVLVAATDSRIKAAVPSCGGISDYPSELHWENSKYCGRVNCPILFLNPVNDFYGKADDLATVAASLPSREFRFSCAANLDHRDRPEHFVCGPLWFDQHLKGALPLQKTPGVSLRLQTVSGIPAFSVTPDTSRPVKSVDVFFTQQSRDAKCPNPCWQHVKPTRNDNTWSAELPLLNLDQPLRAYANVSYTLDAPITGAGYYYSLYTATEFTLSSPIKYATPEMLMQAKVRATDQPSRIIEAFETDWLRGWYVFNESGNWPYRTNKLQSPKWSSPAGAKLVLDVQTSQANTLVLKLDDHAVVRELVGGEMWQTVALSSADFHDALGNPLANWTAVNEFVISPKETLKMGGKIKVMGADWNGPLPKFRNLRWDAP